jgi:hypothetical protein
MVSDTRKIKCLNHGKLSVYGKYCKVKKANERKRRDEDEGLVGSQKGRQGG